MEEEKKILEEQDCNVPLEKKRPIGVAILANINIVLNGIIPLILVVFPKRLDFLFVQLRETVNVPIDFSQFKTIIVVFQSIASIVFIISGIGLLLRKEWARKLILYFATVLVITAALSVLASASLLSHAFLQIIYPGALIIYFTNKKIEDYFKR